MTNIVLSMRTHKMIGQFTDDAAADACHEANPPAYTVRRGNLSDLTAADLVRIYNACEGVTPVTRFSDRKTAERRVMEALRGAVTVVVEAESAEIAAVAAAIVTEAVVDAAAERAPMELKIAAPDELYRLTPTGAKDSLRFQKGSARFLVFSAVKEAGKDGARVSTLCGTLGPLTRAQIRGCLDKLRALHYIEGGN